MQFTPYNRKGFLLPDSIHSMACFHAKIYENGDYRFRIHDCITSIRLIGKLETEQDFNEAIEKCINLADALTKFANHVFALKAQLFTSEDKKDLLEILESFTNAAYVDFGKINEHVTSNT
jgi:hypothetical protein